MKDEDGKESQQNHRPPAWSYDLLVASLEASIGGDLNTSSGKLRTLLATSYGFVSKSAMAEYESHLGEMVQAGGTSPHGDTINAFAHAYASALIYVYTSQYLSENLGGEVATVLGNIKEISYREALGLKGDTQADSIKDQLNNALGRDVGRYIVATKGGVSDIPKILVERYKNGDFYLLEPAESTIVHSDGEPFGAVVGGELVVNGVPSHLLLEDKAELDSPDFGWIDFEVILDDLFKDGTTAQDAFDVGGYDIFGFSHFDYDIDSSEDHQNNSGSGQDEHTIDSKDGHDTYEHDLQEGIEINDLSDAGGYSSDVSSNERDGRSSDFNNFDHRSPGNTST